MSTSLSANTYDEQVLPNTLQPRSSMCPTILTDVDGNATFIIGAAGGSHIPTAVASSLIRYFMTLYLKIPPLSLSIAF